MAASAQEILPPEPDNGELRTHRRGQIAAFEALLHGLDPADKIDPESVISHHFGGGVYGREMAVKAGDWIVSKRHKEEGLAILLWGQIVVYTEDGTRILTSPQILVSPAGVKRVGRALTDVRWLALHAVGEERDLAVIEAQCIEGETPHIIEGECVERITEDA